MMYNKCYTSRMVHPCSLDPYIEYANFFFLINTETWNQIYMFYTMFYNVSGHLIYQNRSWFINICDGGWCFVHFCEN